MATLTLLSSAQVDADALALADEETAAAGTAAALDPPAPPPPTPTDMMQDGAGPHQLLPESRRDVARQTVAHADRQAE